MLAAAIERFIIRAVMMIIKRAHSLLTIPRERAERGRGKVETVVGRFTGKGRKGEKGRNRER